jgi:pimeloyl-ACP methyl ester carboxylesterase
MDIEKRSFIVCNSLGDPIHGDIRIKAGSAGAPVIICSHGFTGFKDWGSMPYMAERFARDGFCVVTFNFSRGGLGNGGEKFTEPEKFANNTISIELDDLHSLLLAVREGKIPEMQGSDPGHVLLLGHSRGGGVSIITAKENLFIQGVAVWGSIARFDRWSERQKREWREKGEMRLRNIATLRMLPVFLDDLEAHADRLNILDAVSHLHCPLLIVHGEQDIVVPANEARKLYTAGDPATTTLVVVPNSGHVFGAEHPFKGTTAALDEAISVTVRFFKEIIAAR